LPDIESFNLFEIVTISLEKAKEVRYYTICHVRRIAKEREIAKKVEA
jgi:hypothetical protein